MKHARKMVLVDFDKVSEDNSENLKTSPDDTASNENHDDENLALSFLDLEMNNILGRKDLSDNDKWRLYSQALERHLFHIRSKQQNEANDIKQFNGMLNNIHDIRTKVLNTPKNAGVQQSVLKVMKNLRTKIPKKKIRKTKKKVPIANVDRISLDSGSPFIRSRHISISSDDDELFENCRSGAVLKKTPQLRNSKGRFVKKSKKTTERIFSNWERYPDVKHELNID